MSGERRDWPALDVLRGIAVLCMLMNHASVRLLDEHDLSAGVAASLSFAGSFAPVLFFLATGVGYGLAHRPGAAGDARGVWVKAGILIVADAFLRSGEFPSIGWDFLGFIALSMLILQALRGRRHGVMVAVALIAALVLVRYGLGPYYREGVDPDAPSHWMAPLLGIRRFPGAAYWFAPWLVYPLVGFVVGVTLSRYRAFYRGRVLPICVAMLATAAAIGAVSHVLKLQGLPLFRWGTMSLNFFIASFACVAAALALAGLVGDRWRNASAIRALSLRGVSSLAVVPIHYLLLGLSQLAMPPPISQASYLMFLLPFGAACFYLACQVENLSRIVPVSRTATCVMVAIVAVSALVCGLSTQEASRFLAAHLAQLILAVLVGLAYSGRRASAFALPDRMDVPSAASLGRLR